MECQRRVAAAKFAPHLEKCMGLGRTSGRLKSKKPTAPPPFAHTGFTQDLNDQDDVDFTFLVDSDAESEEEEMPIKKRSSITGCLVVTLGGDSRPM